MLWITYALSESKKCKRGDPYSRRPSRRLRRDDRRRGDRQRVGGALDVKAEKLLLEY
jgi:hypothetical protein